MLSFDREHGSRLAAQLGFYSLMAFPALFLIAIWVLGVIFNSADVQSKLVDAVMNSLPLDAVQGRREISTLLEGLSRGAGNLGLVSVLVLLYAGSGAVGAVRQAVETSQGPGAPGRRFPGSKVFDILVTAVTMPVLLIVIGLALSRDISKVVEKEPVLDLLSRFSGGGISVTVISVLLFSWLYWIQNPGDRTWTSTLVGGAVTTALVSLIWLGLKIWFGITGGGAAVYGVLAGFIGTLLFLNLACLAVVMGAHLAASFRRYRGTAASVE